ncbi:hypothetical protein [Haloparvum sedimenti]|uniref:hypothetical protein n=1 Tax=Haloparvum sedimenti TaxID=1678448 RepID=UPI00071E7A93|nr:hypothetical protein [Haloparvum sedimenti]
MNARTRLEHNLIAESEAYGYTLAVWGAGALLIDAFGVPDVWGVLAYVGGALAGFALLAEVAWGGMADEMTAERSPTSRVASAIHLLSTGGALLAARGLIVAVASAGAGGRLAFLLVGVAVTVTYNLLLLVEEFLGGRLD